MNETINLSSMTADSTAALKKLNKDLKDLRQLLEVRALRENDRSVTLNPQDLACVELEQSFRESQGRNSQRVR